MQAEMQSLVAGLLRTRSNATTSGLLTSTGVAPLRMGRDDMWRACTKDAKSCDYRRFWAKVDLMFDRADPLDERALHQWLGDSDETDSRDVAPAASSAATALIPAGDVWSSGSGETDSRDVAPAPSSAATALIPAGDVWSSVVGGSAETDSHDVAPAASSAATAPIPAGDVWSSVVGGSDETDSHDVAPAASSAATALIPAGNVWSNQMNALEAKHRALASSNRARLTVLCESRRAAAESGARSRTSFAGSVTALSLELTYRRMQAWKAVAHALRRGVCDKVPGFNRLEHEQASALPPSWLIRSGTRGKTARAAGVPNSPDVAAPSSGDATPTSTAAAAAAVVASVAAGGAPPPPQPTPALEPDDDTVCAVCFDGESTESNQIVFCDGCNIAIHQSCYGIRAIPRKSYFCERCVEVRTRERYSSRRAARNARPPPSCCLCPCTGGALKRTTDGRWAHIVCALWLPSAKFVIQQDMGPIDVSACVIASSGDADSPGACSVCNKGDGCVVRCTGAEFGRCGRSFHPLCAWYAGYFMRAGERIATSPTGAARGNPAQLLLGTASICLQSFCPNCTPAAELARGRSRQQQRRIRVKYRVLPTHNTDAELSPLDRARARSRARRGSLSTLTCALEPDCYRDGACAVCFRAGGGNAVEGEQQSCAEDELQHCARCGISVHAYCYSMRKGARTSLEWWCCDSCAAGNLDTDVVCVLCPRRGGAFKRTTCGRQAHITCAWWTPGVELVQSNLSSESCSRTASETGGGTGGGEVSINVLCLPKNAFGGAACYSCGQEHGVLVQCAAPSCERKFHANCGNHNFHWMEVQASIAGGVVRKTYCHEHCPPGHVRDDATQGWMQQELPVGVQRALRTRAQLDHTRLLSDLVHRREELKLQRLMFEREAFESRLTDLQKRRSDGIANLRKARLRDRSKAGATNSCGVKSATSPALPQWARLLIERGPRAADASTRRGTERSGEGGASLCAAPSSEPGSVGFESIVSALPVLHAATEALRKLRVEPPSCGDRAGGGRPNPKRSRDASSVGDPQLALDARLIQLLDASHAWLAAHQAHPQIKSGALITVAARIQRHTFPSEDGAVAALRAELMKRTGVASSRVDAMLLRASAELDAPCDAPPLKKKVRASKSPTKKGKKGKKGKKKKKKVAVEGGCGVCGIDDRFDEMLLCDGASHAHSLPCLTRARADPPSRTSYTRSLALLHSLSLLPGGCNGEFHSDCLGLSLPPSDCDWWCKDCTRERGTMLLKRNVRLVGAATPLFGTIDAFEPKR